MHYVFLAGIGGSEPEHWQSRWYRRLAPATWVEHADWAHPDRDAWVADLAAALSSVDEPPLVIAHSLGCLLLGEWHRDHPATAIAGAFLVAPPDVDSPAFPAAATGWQSGLKTTLTCPALLVASHDDPYASFAYAERLAAQWCAELSDAGLAGHINLVSGLGDWQSGLDILQRFEAELAASRA